VSIFSLRPQRTSVVAGGAGFVGSHLVEALVARGERVVVIDDLSTGEIRNLADPLSSTQATFIHADVAQPAAALRNLLDLAAINRVDTIYHLASPASPEAYGAHPWETLRANSLGTMSLIELALEYGASLLYTSTSEVYGDPLEHPQKETYWGNVNPVGPRSCYDESKRFGEALVMAYVRAHDIDARIIRIFNTYGPRMRSDDGRVVPNFILQALRGEPLTIYGDGSQTRSFCYVDDLVAGIMSCAGSEATRGRVVNLGNPEEYPIAEFARIVSEIAGTPLRTLARPMPPDDPTRRCPDITVARELLGWEPKVPVREGLRRTIEQMRGTLAQAGASLS
jgi:nucleoside-diphosphate-sugar epimerase